MYLKSNWRILTIGDGDLTFSYSLKMHHQIKTLCASVLDSKTTLTNKYTQNGVDGLTQLGANLNFELDITKPNTWPNDLKAKFDLVIFQFPLVPSAKSKAEFDQALNQNHINRNLLYRYLQACFTQFLDPNGERLAYITSKEVKPYSHWQIETDLTIGSNIAYLGKQVFDYTLFPDYQIRNVDRDKKVKDTQGFIYAYSDKKINEQISQQFEPFAYLGTEFCSLCRVGPFTSQENYERHINSSKHLKLATYQRDWYSYLASLGVDIK